MGVHGKCIALVSLPMGKSPLTHCIGGRVASRPVWTGVENLALTGVSTSNCPPCSKSLYQLHYSVTSSCIYSDCCSNSSI